MAKIEMDLSEYKLMEETKKLLEEAVKREQTLTAEIKELHQEKIALNEEKLKAYEKASMSVAYIKRHVNEEYFYGEPTEKVSKILSSFIWNHAGELHSSLNNSSVVSKLLEIILREIPKTKALSSSETVEYKGVDEFKDDLKDKLQKELDADTKLKLEQYADMIVDFANLKGESEGKTRRIEELENQLANSNKELEFIKTHLDNFRELFKKVKDVIVSTSFFGKRAGFNEIKTLLSMTHNKV